MVSERIRVPTTSRSEGRTDYPGILRSTRVVEANVRLF